MSTVRRFSLHSTAAIAFVALLVALGGSALAGDARSETASVAQRRCANGAVRGFAIVTGNPSAGIANVPGQFTANRALFRRAFNCTGRATQVRRTAAGVFEVRFVGSRSQAATATGFADFYATVEPLSPGTFQVIVHPAGRDDRADVAFTIVAV